MSEHTFNDFAELEQLYTRYRSIFLALPSDSIYLNTGDSRVIWLGDLNYRIALSYSDTRKLLEGNNWDALLGKDQVVG